MRSFKLLPVALVVVVMAAMFASAASAAEWKREGKPLNETYQWFKGGKALSGESGTLNLSGTFAWTLPGTSAWGGYSCPASGKMTANPGTSGTLSEFQLDGANCKGTGWMQFCKVYSVTTTAPTEITATKDRTVQTGSIGIIYKTEAGPWCFGEVFVLGTFTATPNKSGEISSFSLSGSPMVYFPKETFRGNASLSGSTLNVSPAGEYGIDVQDDVALSGNLTWTDGLGTISCPYTATTVLQSGGTGQLAMSWPSACSVSGSKTGPTVTVTSTSPWSFTNEGSTIKVGSVDLTLKYKGKLSEWTERFTGSLTATPNNTSAISSSPLSGTLQRPAGGTSWSGSASWNPAGVFGL